MPGISFLRPPDELTTRFCFVDFDGEKFFEAGAPSIKDLPSVDDAEAVSDFVRANMTNMYDGIQSLKAFVVKYSKWSFEISWWRDNLSSFSSLRLVTLDALKTSIKHFFK